jgi:hypothetical protein
MSELWNSITDEKLIAKGAKDSSTEIKFDKTIKVCYTV